MLDNDGNAVEGQQLNELAQNYFQKIFAPKMSSFDEVVKLVPCKLSDDDNAVLLASFTEEEFRIATFQMHPDKSPGPDGLNPAFYQWFWSTCGKDDFQACTQWLSQGVIPEYISDTNIVLIPKCDQPISMRDLRPISLCNVSYKILAKLLFTRLSSVIDKCISEEQSVFIASRSILDNPIIASEILHHMMCKTIGNRGEAALKIDISKAFDRVGWDYLAAIMLKLGFSTQWVHWIYLCISSSSLSILVNNEPVGPIKPGRGLR